MHLSLDSFVASDQDRLVLSGRRPTPVREPQANGVALSFVVPMFNAAASITSLVEAIFAEFADESIEVILVNDGSSDDTEGVGRALAGRFPGQVTYVHLARNFGEHRAAAAGIRQSRGRHVVVLDDDGQNPPAEVRRLRAAAEQFGWDVVYGRYVERRHPWHRRAVSAVHNWLACWLTGKPRGLYLSSFKLMNRFVADELSRNDDPFPHLDGMILDLTRNLGQIDVLHRPRMHGRSGYTAVKLVRLWLDLVVGRAPTLFLAGVFGGGIAALGGMLAVLAAAWRDAPPSIFSTAVATIASGLLVLYLGLLGECVVRCAAHAAGKKPFVVRYVVSEKSA